MLVIILIDLNDPVAVGRVVLRLEDLNHYTDITYRSGICRLWYYLEPLFQCRAVQQSFDEHSLTWRKVDWGQDDHGLVGVQLERAHERIRTSEKLCEFYDNKRKQLRTSIVLH